MGAAQACGKCAKINYQGRSTTVQVVDFCPSCAKGGLDISHASMGDLVGSYDRATELGVLFNATWNWVDCSTLSVDRTFRGPSYIIGST